MSYPGRLSGIPFVPAHPSNYAVGRGEYVPEAVVLHIAEGPASAAISWFATGIAERVAQGWTGGPSSAHFVIAEDGAVTQCVDLQNTAYANGQEPGAWAWVLQENPGANANQVTISIEFAGYSGRPPTDSQMRSGIDLIARLFREVLLVAGATGVVPDRNHITRHSDFAPQTRANCPGWSSEVQTAIIDGVARALSGAPEPEPEHQPEPQPGPLVLSISRNQQILARLATTASASFWALGEQETPEVVAWVKGELQRILNLIS
jgi:hypothetical protein